MTPFTEARWTGSVVGRRKRNQNNFLSVASGSPETDGGISGGATEAAWFHVFPQRRRIPSPMTDVLVRGAALAVMLLACSRVSDVLVRCPAVELMVLAC